MKNLTKLSVLFGSTALVGTVAQASTDYGPAIYRPMSGCSKWYSSGNGHHFAVVHDMEGYYWSTISYLNRCDVSVSIHYMVNGLKDTSTDAPAGEITQSVREAYYAWHACCWNTWMWGTEHEGFASNPAWYTTAMYNASAPLQKHLVAQTGHPIDRNHIIGHNEHNNANWRSWMAANYPSINSNCNTHSDPGPYWDWSRFMGLVNGQNPPYYFDSDAQGWFSGNSLSALTWTACCGWPGIIYADQTGNDAFYYSGSCSYTGGAEASCNVSVYPQSGNTANHDMQIFWKTAADNTWTASKSSPVVSYTLQNNWARINLDINQAWPTYYNQNVNQLRLDMDNNNSATRWIINHVITQGSLRWRFDSDAQGWTVGNALTGFTWTACCGWPGIIYADQSGNDPQFVSSGGWQMYGAINDTIHVHVFPQNGSTANHDMQIFFASGNENFFSEDKSLTVYYTAKDAWADVWFDLGVNGKWNGDYIRQIRLDPDQANQGNRWIIDSVTVEHNTYASYIHAPTIGQQPPSTTVNAGQSATFSVFPNGPAPFTYQWKFNGVNITGATGMSYTKANCQAGDAGNYSCNVANAGGNVTSANAVLTVNAGGVPPSITTQPVSQSIVQGNSVTFSVVASGDPTLTYQWRLNGANISGANAASYTDSNVQPADGGNYSVVVSNPYGSATSANATLTVRIPPSITGQPANQTVAQGGSATFTVTAAGDPTLAYQWLFNGANITGANASSYTKANAQPADQGNYSVVVSNPYGSVTSANATLTTLVTAIVDNSDGGFTASASWSTGTSSTDKYGADYRFRSTAATSDQASWVANLANTGNYNVYAWWSQGANRSTSAPYTVFYNGGSAPVSKNQQTAGGTWNLLGTYSLLSGNNTVKLSCWTGTGFVVIADAIKWVQQ